MLIQPRKICDIKCIAESLYAKFSPRMNAFEFVLQLERKRKQEHRAREETAEKMNEESHIFLQFDA